MNFTTKQISIENIVLDKLEFLIPVYQRPYVWDDTEIKKLLEDLKHNFTTESNEYFVGNTYVIKSIKENKKNQYEVIDGQQRFTTFWLISLCFKTLNIDTKLTRFLEIEKDIRFDFDIRKEVYEYLKGLLDGTAERRYHDVSKFEFLKNVATGLETIKSYLKSEIQKEKLASFGDFIYEKTMFIFNEAPLNTDLNALFVALGTTGIQLQQSDILKARLLDRIEEKERRIVYSKIWEACENMSNYFESNVKLSFNYDTSKVTEINFKDFSFEKFYKDEIIVNAESNNEKGFVIAEIIKFDQNKFFDDTTNKVINSECRSIISFNVFLFHVIRIYRKSKKIETDIDSMDPKKLLETIKIDDIEDVIEFIELMWKVRYQFDKHVVKWLKDENESLDDQEKLLLSYINTSKNEDKAYFSRKEKEFSNIQMLQSILYFTGIFTQQYWLTPFLDFLLNNDNNLSDEIILKELELIDDAMIPGNKKDISWEILTKSNKKPDFKNLINSTLKENSGTNFNHYWFYKLEYLLWKNWDKNDPKLKRYRITSKNSIEHVFPQNQEFKMKLIVLNETDDWLNSIGNLALLSVGQNSSYSNQDVEKKRVDFDRKDTFDSLKLAKIYSHLNWNTDEIIKHQDEMVLIILDHYLIKDEIIQYTITP
jgi:uncharacterized protein with ParB-like and HNH nuclease domain